ncbi:hypothetical protein DPEC_G00276130 [Dallia pectoralis]|uniref:Uncharacterized protein n=1 Tax=Dallia pectoralis TaxID=75939 RepID=A0ACC2FLL3_DALPE|nr:hypothetical protein DPEC_G00276130 [Dallia pectoralis]
MGASAPRGQLPRLSKHHPVTLQPRATTARPITLSPAFPLPGRATGDSAHSTGHSVVSPDNRCGQTVLIKHREFGQLEKKQPCTQTFRPERRAFTQASHDPSSLELSTQPGRPVSPVRYDPLC